jgi:hypothetical protein
MRRTPGSRDDVYRRLHGSAQLNSYRVVYKDPDRLIYIRRSGADRSIHQHPTRRGSALALSP